MMKSMKNNITVLLMIIFISHTITPVNAEGKRGKISRHFKLVFRKFIWNLKIKVFSCTRFDNRFLLQLLGDQGPLISHELMQHLTMGNAEEKAKSLSYTKTSYGDQQYSTSMRSNNFRFKINKRSPCYYTGSIQFICAMWQLIQREGADVLAGRSRSRPLNRILSREERHELNMIKKYKGHIRF